MKHPPPFDHTWCGFGRELRSNLASGESDEGAAGDLQRGEERRAVKSWVAYIRRARAPELPVVLLEDFAALVGLVLALFGVGLTLLTGNGVWDGGWTACEQTFIRTSTATCPISGRILAKRLPVPQDLPGARRTC